MNRLYNLDYLRGICAFSIMIYHYLSWSYGSFDISNIMGRIGIYGVSIFYILSGITLYNVYFNKFKFNFNNISSFIIKRVFRIFPLLWITTFLTIMLNKNEITIKKLILNLTGLFSFISWDDYYAVGIWSIGNEICFYIIFPFLILFAKKYKLLLFSLTVLLFGLYLYFAFLLLDTKIIESQWRVYTNPLNQAFLFVGGFLIAHFTKNLKINQNINLIILVAAILIFAFYPLSGKFKTIITSWNRILFTLVCFIISFSFYKNKKLLPDFFHKTLVFVGESSYSIYLLHPIIKTIVFTCTYLISKYFFVINIEYSILLSILFTLLVSQIMYKYFEQFFIKLGNKTTKNIL